MVKVSMELCIYLAVPYITKLLTGNKRKARKRRGKKHRDPKEIVILETDNAQTSGNYAEIGEAVALVGGSDMHSTMVEMFISCTNLRAADKFSKSDPVAVLYEKTADGWKEMGRTEGIKNTSNPNFSTSIKVVYSFERVKEYLVVLVDTDKGDNAANIDALKTTGKDFLGQAQFEIAAVVTAPNKQVVKPLQIAGKDIASQVSILVEELSTSREYHTISLVAEDLQLSSQLSRSNSLFLVVLRQQDDGKSWLPVFHTGLSKNSANPVWSPFGVATTALCRGDIQRPIKLQMFNHNDNGRHKLIGELVTTAEELAEAHQEQKLLTLHKGRKEIGSLMVASFMVEQRPTFLDYVMNGTEIGFMVAVDFSASNKQPDDPESLHYINPNGGYTPYEEVIVAIGGILDYYDYDKQYPCYGMGAVYQRPPTQHCFIMNRHHPQGHCSGIPGILTAYRQSLCDYQLAGPTLFAPVIRVATQVAAHAVANSVSTRYFCLLLLTDGDVMDMTDTIEAIIDASSLPLSILIVGVGDGNFDQMDMLDSDDGLLVGRRSGKKAARDIVQFVEFNRFRNDALALATEVLSELPGQLVQYMRTNHIKPLHMASTRTRSMAQVPSMKPSFDATPIPEPLAGADTPVDERPPVPLQPVESEINPENSPYAYLHQSDSAEALSAAVVDESQVVVMEKAPVQSEITADVPFHV